MATAAAQSDPQGGQRRQNLMSMMSTHGGMLVHNVCLGICGQTPWRSVKDGDFNLSTLLFEIGNFDLNVLSQLLQYAMSQLPLAYAGNEEKKDFVQKLLATYGSSTGQKAPIRRAVREIVGKFGSLSRQNFAKVRRKEMAAKHAEKAKIR